MSFLLACRSVAPGEQRDARHAVLTGRVVGSLGDEPVGGVLTPALDPEASGFDRLAVAVALHRAADAGGPQRGVAGDALGELLGADDVSQRQTAAGAQRAGRGGE